MTVAEFFADQPPYSSIGLESVIEFGGRKYKVNQLSRELPDGELFINAHLVAGRCLFVGSRLSKPCGDTYLVTDKGLVNLTSGYTLDIPSPIEKSCRLIEDWKVVVS